MAIKIIVDANTMRDSMSVNAVVTETITGKVIPEAAIEKAVSQLPHTITCEGLTIVRTDDGGMTIEMSDKAIQQYNFFIVRWAPALVNAFKALGLVLKAYSKDVERLLSKITENLKYDGIPYRKYIEIKMDEAIRAESEIRHTAE